MLAAINYVPLLRTKPAEINAYHTLSLAEKSSIFPVFLAKPWQNANRFQKTIDKVLGAVGSASFGLGIDRSFIAGGAKQPAQSEFDELFDATGGYRAYFDFISSIPSAVPMFLGGATADQVLLQLGHADQLGRGLLVRFTRDEIIPLLSLAGDIPPLPNDTVFIVDAGWSRDPLQLSQWADANVRRILDAVPTAEIVVMASSFPDSFSSIVGHGSVVMHEAQVFSVIRANFNQAALTYGDWATTRPPQSGGGGTIPPRIDIPRAGVCEVFRADLDQAETYSDMAQTVIAHECFSAVPACYGRSMIESTPSGQGITGTQRATEVRINIHMAVHSAPQSEAGIEEAYVD